MKMTRPDHLPPPTPAATVVIFRKGPPGHPPELLMMERAGHMRFAAGATVFPGGAVDAADRELASLLEPPAANAALLSDEDHAARVAAVRETLEEAGLLIGVKEPVTLEQVMEARRLLVATGALGPVLDEFGWSLDLSRLVPFARWCPHFSRAFDTFFYLADLGTGAVSLEVDGTENDRVFWMSARDALTATEAGTLSVLLPTLMTLHRLAQFETHAQAKADAHRWPVQTISAWVEDRDGQAIVTIPAGLGFPVTTLLADRVRRD
jgi:NUDIX domain.